MMQLLFTAYLLLTFILKHKPYPQLNPERSPVLYLSAITKLVNKDQNMKLMKKHKTNKKQKKQTKRTVSYMNPNFDPDILNMHDLTQFHQQVNHFLMLLEIKFRNKKTKNDKTNIIPNTINNKTKQT